MKEHNIRHHFKNEHEVKCEHLTGELGKNKICQLKAFLIGQQNMFKKQTSHEFIVYASYVVADIIANEKRPFTD
jgi:hypothetical protein